MRPARLVLATSCLLTVACAALGACGGANTSPSRVTVSSAPTAVVSLGLPSGVPTGAPNGIVGPAPAFVLTLTAASPSDTFSLEFAPPDASFVLRQPDFCGPATGDPQPCSSGGTYRIGPFFGLQLAGTEGHYGFVRVRPPHQVTTIAEGTVDLTRSETVSATYP